MTMVLSLGLTFAASAEDWTHPEYDPFADEKLPEANMEHPFDAAIAEATPVLFELSKPKYNYTYQADGTSTTPTIIKKVAADGSETVVDAADETDATYKYYVEFPTVTVDGKMYVVVETWAQIASLARAGVGSQFKDGLNLVFKKDITPAVMVELASDDKLVTEKSLQYIFAPVAEGVNNIPGMSPVGTDRPLVIDGNGYGLTNFSMNYVAGTRSDNKHGLFGGLGGNLTLQNMHVGTKAAPIAFAFAGESGLLTSWVDGATSVTTDNFYLYMKGTGNGSGHMGGLAGNHSNGSCVYNITNSVYAFEIVREGHSSGNTATLGCQQSPAVIKKSDFFCNIIAGGGDNGMVAASGNGAWEVENVNIYGYGFSTNNMSGFGGFSAAAYTFKNVTNYATLAGNGGGSIAGFVGNCVAGGTHTYENCHNKGDIYQVGNAGWSFAGGFEGRAQSAVTMTNCTNTGDILGVYAAGGFLAESSTGENTFTNCSNGTKDVPVIVTGGGNLGGFIGTVGSASTFTDCFSFVGISGTDNAGGFTGWTSGATTFTNCTAIVSGKGRSVSGLAAKTYFGQSTPNPNETLTPEQDADDDGIADARQAAGVVATECETVVYAFQSSWVAPLVGTYYQYVTDPTTADTIVIEWRGLDLDKSTENISNVDGDGVETIMTKEAIVTLIGEELADGIDSVGLDYTAAATEDGNFVRVFATSAVLPAEYVGFTFSYTYTDENGVLTEAPERTYWCAEVYNGLEALDYSYQKEIPATEEGAEPTYETVYLFEAFDACKLAGSYVWALTFENVPAGDVTITIKAFADDVTSSSTTIVLRDGNVYTAPVEGDITEG